MTGFGRAEIEHQGWRHEVRLRSLNNRFLEISLKLPPDLWPWEAEARGLIQSALSRGKIEVHWREERAGAAGGVRADLDLARAYRKALEELAAELGLPAEIRLEYLARLPEVLRRGEPQAAEAEAAQRWEGLRRALAAALEDLQAARAREGEKLRLDLEALLARCREWVDRIEQSALALRPVFEQRLKARMEEALQMPLREDSRIALEAALLAERADIHEEIVRFRAHLEEFGRALAAGDGEAAEGKRPEALGKRLDFLCQELLREANTMGSKSPDAGLTRQVVALKAEVEKIKEQVQNLE